MGLQLFKDIQMKRELNRKYLTSFSFLNDPQPNSISIWKSDIKFFVKEAIRQGNCFTLYHDLNLFNLDDVWDEAYFQNVCQWAYITFTDKQLEKELKRLRNINLDNLQFLHDTLSKIPHPYAKVPENSTDKTFAFCKQKLGYLSKNQNFKPVIQQDEKNRIRIIEYLQKKINVISNSSTKSNGPFSRILIGDPEKTKRILQEEFEKLELGFDFFKERCGRKPGKERNKDHFNGTCVAIIKFLSDNDFLTNDNTWESNLDLYLKETKNKISTKGFISSGYYNDNTYDTVKRKLSTLIIRDIKKEL